MANKFGRLELGKIGLIQETDTETKNKNIEIIRLEYCNKLQIQISNGNKMTTEFMIQDDFYRRGLANEA